MFCSQSVFICVLSISEQATIFSLYAINWFYFITEKEYFYWEVRNKY